MIPAIALMIGAYIITNMVSMLADREETGPLTKIFAVVTILITILCIYSVIVISDPSIMM